MKKLTLILLISVTSQHSIAKDIQGRIPDEYESAGGHALALSNAGIAAMAGQSAVKLNPAMLPLEKTYSLTTGYHWPSVGREFYQIGVVDSVTSEIGAGVLYTSSQNEFLGNKENPYETNSDKYNEYNINSSFDSPIKKRVALGIGKAFDKMSVGLGVQYVDAWDITELTEITKRNAITGTTIGLGIAGLITPQIRFALSSENMANEAVKEFAPTTYRAGIAYLMAKGDVTVHLDYRDRERVLFENKSSDPLLLLSNNSSTIENVEESEKMVIGSFSARVQDLLRILGGYGQEVSGGGRTSVSGGIALLNQSYSLSYMVSKPYINDKKLHQSINLNLNIKM